MPITMTCPGCQATFRLAEALAGRKARCEKCAAVFAVPTVEGAPVARESAIEFPAASADEPSKASEQLSSDCEETKPTPIEVVEPPTVEHRPVLRESAPRRRQPTKPAAPASGLAGILTIVATLFLAGFCLVGLGMAALWIFAGKQAQQPFVVVNDMKQVKDPVIVGEQKKLEPVIPGQPGGQPGGQPAGVPELLLDPNGRSLVRENAVVGNRSYRVHLQENKHYNFYVVGLFGFAPRLDLSDGVGRFAGKEQNTTTFLAFVAKKTGEHTITVMPRFGANNGAFDLYFAPVVTAAPQPIDLAGQPSAVLASVLRIHDPVLRDRPGDHGVYREFTLPVKAGTEYPLKLTTFQDLKAVLILKDGPRVLAEQPAGFNLRIDFLYKADFTGKLTIIVSTRAHMLGDFTLTVTEDRPGPRTVAFDFAGRYLRDDNLSDADPFDGKLHRAKTYLIPIEAGHGYNIDLRSIALDGFLTLHDSDGKVVAQDNNSGGNFNARILFDARATGQYKLLATDFKKANGAFTVEINKFKLPVSTPADVKLNLKKRQQSGCDIVETIVPTMANPVSSFVWAPDGKGFVLLDPNGVLRRYRYPDFVETGRLSLGQGSWTMHRCAEGLLLSRSFPNELWVIDPQAFELKRRLVRVGSNIIHTGSDLDAAFTFSNVIQAQGGQTPGIARHSLKAPNLSLFSGLSKGAQPLAVTPDGRFILTRDSAGKMSRWRFDGKSVKLEETSAFLARPWLGQRQPYLVSPDGKLVAHLVDTKILPRDNIQPAPPSGRGIAVFKLADLSKPLCVIDTQILTLDVAFEPKSGLLCAFNKTKGLMLIDPYQDAVVRTLAIDLPDPFATTLWSLSPHPDGGVLIGFNGSTFNPKLLAITLPGDLPKVKSE